MLVFRVSASKVRQFVVRGVCQCQTSPRRVYEQVEIALSASVCRNNYTSSPPAKQYHLHRSFPATSTVALDLARMARERVTWCHVAASGDNGNWSCFLGLKPDIESSNINVSYRHQQWHPPSRRRPPSLSLKVRAMTMFSLKTRRNRRMSMQMSRNWLKLSTNRRNR